MMWPGENGSGAMRPGENKREFRFFIEKRRLILALLWLPVYIFILPILLTLLQNAAPTLSDSYAEFLLQALSAVYLLAVLFPFLRGEFDNLLEHAGRAVLAVLGGLFVYFALGYACTALSLTLVPNAEEIFKAWDAEWAAVDRGPAIAALVILAPLTEGLLFRGCVFGLLRKKRRVLAYVVAVAVYVLAQAWWPGVMGAELLLGMIQTLPAAVVLCWSYETGRSLWASIFLQMLISAINV